jgi:hypothetical protein
VAEPLEAPLPIADPQGPDIQHQIDDLRLALQAWRQTREYAQPTQSRLEQLTLQCARLVDTWQQVERRNGGPTGLAARPEDGAAIEQGLKRATGDRIQALEQAIEQEWEALRTGPDDPAQKLTEQAASLAESCVAAANLALRGFANAESRVAALENEIKTGMSQLSRDLQSILGELRSTRTAALPGANSAFPLEGVMRIHQELRESNDEAAPEARPLPAVPPRALPGESEAAKALTARVESLERAISASAEHRSEQEVQVIEDATSSPRAGWWPWIAAAAVVAALAGTALFGLWQQRRIDAHLNEAALQVAAAERQRDATVAAARDEATRQVADAQRAAAQAQIVSNVLAAPDLVRYWLRGAGQYADAYAQVHFSRSRGAVFSATRLQPASGDRTYQLWLLTRGGPVNAGLVTPDAEGRATLAIDYPIALSGRLTGAVLTLEPAGGRTEPTGEAVLTRIAGN